LRNDGKGSFRDMKEIAGPAFHTRYDARGLAVGDYDNDGDIDAAFVCLRDAPVLLRNNAGQDHGWVGFQLVGTKSNRDAIGSKLTVRLGDRKLVRWITGGSSIFSSHDNRAVFGLGANTGPPAVSVEIQWPSGVAQTVDGLATRRYHKLVEPSGRMP
jgi:hypothetical protein